VLQAVFSLSVSTFRPLLGQRVLECLRGKDECPPSSTPRFWSCPGQEEANELRLGPASLCSADEMSLDFACLTIARPHSVWALAVQLFTCASEKPGAHGALARR
jgi:hypothetical protein